MDYLNTQTTTTNNSGNNLTPEMKKYYDRALIRFAKPKLVHAEYGQQKPIPSGSGKTIEFRRFSPLPKALTPLTEGVTPKGNKLNVTTVESTVEQYGDYVTMSDMLTLTAVDSVISETQNVLGDQAGRTLDTVIREKINAGTNVQYGNGKADRNLLKGGETEYSDNDYLNVATVKRAVATLKRNNAAPFKDGCYVAIIHPDVANDLTNDPEWKAVKQNVDPKDWYKGEIGRIHGVAFIESTEAKIFHPDRLLSDGDSENAELETLTVKSVSENTVTIKEALSADEAAHISGKKVQIGGLDYLVSSAAAGSAGSAKIVLSETPKSTAENDIIYPSGGGAKGRDIYSTLFIGQNAYGVTSISGGGLQTILKQRGSAGTGDPLDQRSTVGWKATQTAEILSPEFLVRVETTCSY